MPLMPLVSGLEWPPRALVSYLHIFRKYPVAGGYDQWQEDPFLCQELSWKCHSQHLWCKEVEDSVTETAEFKMMFKRFLLQRPLLFISLVVSLVLINLGVHTECQPILLMITIQFLSQLFSLEHFCNVVSMSFLSL